MKNRNAGAVQIECPNTIFHLFVKTEDELAKIEIFMYNIRYVKKLGINDIYNWCNRQGIAYNTRFNYHKGVKLPDTIRSYLNYSQYKMKYKYQLSFT